MRDLGEALECDVGVMWIPQGNALAASAVWQAHPSPSPQLETEVRKARLAHGAGLAGSAWVSAIPTGVADLTTDALDALQVLERRIGMYGSLAVPAVYGEEVLAVLTFASRHKTVLTDQVMRSLLGIGHEVGHFLARRRGELSASVLTARELQVLQLSGTGFIRRQIADEIDLSEATVKTHFEHIYQKLGVPDRASAVAEALRQAIID